MFLIKKKGVFAKIFSLVMIFLGHIDTSETVCCTVRFTWDHTFMTSAQNCQKFPPFPLHPHTSEMHSTPYPFGRSIFGRTTGQPRGTRHVRPAQSCAFKLNRCTRRYVRSAPIEFERIAQSRSNMARSPK